MQYLTKNEKENIIIGYSRKHIYIFDENLVNKIEFECQLSNVNQIEKINEFLIVKNTSGEIICFDMAGNVNWHVKLGRNICTDDKFIYDKTSNSIVFFYYSHNGHDKMWLCRINIFNGQYAIDEYICIENNWYYTYHLFNIIDGKISYFQNCSKDGEFCFSKLIEGGEILKEFAFRLFPMERLANGKYYSYSGYYDLEKMEYIKYRDKSLGGVLYLLAEVGERYYCQFHPDIINNRITVTDLSFNKVASISCKYDCFIEFKNRLLVSKGKKLKYLNLDNYKIYQ